MEFSGPEYWSGWPFLSPGDLPNPESEPRSPTLQADSLPAEPQGKPMETKRRGEKAFKCNCVLDIKSMERESERLTASSQQSL